MRDLLTRRICPWLITAMWLVCTASAADPTMPLQNVLKKSDYNLVYPAQDRIFAGGIVVSDKKHSSFYGLPPGVRPEATSPVTAAWAKADLTSSFSLQALLTGVGSVLNADLSFKRDRRLTLEQITASGFQVDHPETVIANSTVKAQVIKWLQNYNVYVVHTSLATSNISVTASSSFDVKAAFGTTLPTCAASSNGSGGAAATGTASKSAGTQALDGKDTAKSQAVAASGGSKTAPSGSLDACQDGSSKLTLSASKPLVFAASLNPVTMDANGALQVEPILRVAPGAGIRETLLTPSANWEAKDWPKVR